MIVHAGVATIRQYEEADQILALLAFRCFVATDKLLVEFLLWDRVFGKSGR